MVHRDPTDIARVKRADFDLTTPVERPLEAGKSSMGSESFHL